MPLDYARPPATLARELREVSRDAGNLLELLEHGLNAPLPEDFPKEPLIDICQQLVRLPDGTAEGCRTPLDYARFRLPNIRRKYIPSEEVTPNESSIVRGDSLDKLLVTLISSISTALDQYRSLAAEAPETSESPEPGIALPRSVRDDVEPSVLAVDERLGGAQAVIQEVANPRSEPADSLKRQLSDARSLNRLAWAEVRMPRVDRGWMRKTLDALKDYPELIRRSVRALRVGTDIAEEFVEVYHEFKKKFMEFLLNQWREFLGAIDRVAEILDANRLNTDNTISNLMTRYRTDERSPYHKLSYSSRKNYEGHFRRIEKDCGRRKLSEITAQELEHLIEGWKESDKPAMADALATMIGVVINFGAEVLKDRDCERLTFVVRRSRYYRKSALRKSSQRQMMTSTQAAAIVSKAHDLKLHSIAFAQAILFDCKLLQKEVIGEWVPISDKQPSEIVKRGQKWVRGLLWENIDSRFALHHTDSYTREQTSHDLLSHPLVVHELCRMAGVRFPQQLDRAALPAKGPVIVRERWGLPWRGSEYRRKWREAARSADVPDNIFNSDSRPRRTRKGDGNIIGNGGPAIALKPGRPNRDV